MASTAHSDDVSGTEEETLIDDELIDTLDNLESVRALLIKHGVDRQPGTELEDYKNMLRRHNNKLREQSKHGVSIEHSQSDSASPSEVNFDDDDEIDALDDMMYTLGLIKKHMGGAKIAGTSHDDFKNAIKLHNLKAKKQTKNLTADILGKLHHDEAIRRIHLRDICTRVKALTSSLANDNPQIHTYLNKILPDHKTKLDERIENMSPGNDCSILVLGESCAGKSSFINLLLGEEALPCHHLSNTSVICEISHSDKLAAILHPWENDEPPMPITHDTLVGITDGSPEEIREQFGKELKKCIQETQERQKRWKYKRAEIFLPCEILKGTSSKLTIVDSPGVGEKIQELDNLVVDYMLKSFAFIYVLKTSKGGGIQSDKVQMLLKKFKKERLDATNTYFFPECAMFICNKWDQLETKEDRADVMGENVAKLTKLWSPQFNERQLYPLSTTEALYMMNEGYISNRFMKVLEGLRTVITMGSEARVAHTHRYYADLVCKVIEGSNAFIKNYEAGKDIERDLSELEKQAAVAYKSLQTLLYETQLEIVRTIQQYFNRDCVRNDICSWKSMVFPRKQKADRLECTIRQYTQERVTMELVTLEETTECFKSNGDKVIANIQMVYSGLQEQLSSIMSKMGVNNSVASDSAPGIEEDDEGDIGVIMEWMNTLMDTVQDYAFGQGAAFRRHLARKYPFVLMLKLPTSIHISTKVSIDAEIATKYSMDLVDAFLRDGVLNPMIKEQLNEAHKCLTKLKEKLSSGLDAARYLLNELRKQKVIQPNTTEHANVRSNFTEVGKQLAYFKVAWMFKCDLASMTMKETEKPFETLSYDNDETVCCGFKARIHRGTFTEANVRKPIAVRKLNRPVSVENVDEYIREEALYRKDPKSIVHLIAVTKSDGEIYQMFEEIRCSLREYVLRRKSQIGDGREWVTFVTEVAGTITRGLTFLHRCKTVHYDLCMDTVAVTASGQVKLTNISCPGPLERNTRDDILRKPLEPYARYLPPGVVTRTAEYNANSDIHSLAILLWELSTCLVAFDDFITDGMTGAKYFCDLESTTVVKALHMEMYTFSDAWKTAIKKCLSDDKQKNASDIYALLCV